MSATTKSPPVEAVRPMDVADRLYDATALVSAISARVVQLAHESGELSDTASAELTRLLGLVHSQVEGVAGDLFSMKLRA